MAKRLHDQRPEKKMMICPLCKEGACQNCIDRLRSIYTDKPICQCSRVLHTEKRDGEPYLQQITDPLTGIVHAPDLTVDENGEVVFQENPFED